MIARHPLQAPLKGERIIIVGTGETAAFALEYFRHDTPHEVIAFSADAAFVTTGTYCNLPVVPLEELAPLPVEVPLLLPLELPPVAGPELLPPPLLELPLPLDELAAPADPMPHAASASDIWAMARRRIMLPISHRSSRNSQAAPRPLVAIENRPRARRPGRAPESAPC